MRVMAGVAEHLAYMTACVREGKPLYHVRYNDGEAAAMRLMPHDNKANCDGHSYFPSLREELLRCVGEINATPDHTLIGLLTRTDPAHQVAPLLRDLFPLVERQTVGEFWCQEERLEGADELRALFTAIRVNGPSLLIAPGVVQMARHCLGADPLCVPRAEAWTFRDVAGARLLEWRRAQGIERPCVLLWHCGFLGKVLSWDLWRAFPGDIHLDLGHTFDGVFGMISRGWMNRDTPMSCYYFCDFAPYVQSFIPA